MGEVGFAINKAVITGLLRKRMKFEGIIVTDWGLLTDAVNLG
jgi:beta-glucosidase